MKATTFLALVFGVMLGVAGTFAGLYATGAFEVEDSSPRVAQQKSSDDSSESVGDSDVAIEKPEITPETGGNSASTNESASHKAETDPSKPDSAEGSVATEETSETNEGDTGSVSDVASNKDADIDAVKEALKEALGGLGGELPEGVELEDLLGGPKVELRASVSGTVVDGSGAPMAGAKIYADYSEEASSNGGMSISIVGYANDNDSGTLIATTDGSGNWQADVSRKVAEKAKLRVMLTAKSEGFAESKTQTVTVKNGDAKQGIKLTLRGAGSLNGYVRDERGGGVEGVSVSLQKSLSNGFGTFVSFGSGGKYSAKTDASGFYRIENIPEGSYSLRLKALGVREVSGPKEVTIKVGVETSAPAEFVVAQTTALKLRVVDEDGKPVRSYVTVTVEGEGGKALKTLSGMS
ncbi:MAG: carboxypeptidase-like regulatory domain-containing protein, partial [Planctomycetota bacterium]